MGKLDNKVAVVTGASKGIGAGVAREFAAQGASVVVNYATDKAGADRVVAEITANGGEALAIGADLSAEGEVIKLFDAVRSRFGRLDVLVNNAGRFTMGPVEAFSADEFSRVFDTNVRGLLFAARCASPLFPEPGGAIVNLSSVVATSPYAGMSVYAATKGAIDTVTKALAKELGPRNIRVNAISPGYVLTEGVAAAGMPGSPMEQQVIATTPLGRAGSPEDIALPAAFLASDDARFITGAILPVTGGIGI